MKKLAVLLLVALAMCGTTAIYADTINLSENWYIKITSFSLQGWMEPVGPDPTPSPVNFAGFPDIWKYQYSTTSLIEPKLLNPSSDGMSYGTLLFDFHAGQACGDGSAWFCPFATLGSPWAATMSFNWQISCSDPNVVFGVDTINGGRIQDVWWSAPASSNNRSGSISLDVETRQSIPPGFYVSFATVPEPTSLLAVVMFTAGFACRMRRMN